MREKRNGLRPCRLERTNILYNCYFHMFGLCGDANDGICTVALVELEDGSVIETDASYVVFEDIE